MHLLEMIYERQREVYSVENQLVYQILQNVQRWSLILLHCQRQQELYVGSYQCFVSIEDIRGHSGPFEAIKSELIFLCFQNNGSARLASSRLMQH